MNPNLLVIGGITVGTTLVSRISSTGSAKNAQVHRVILGGILYVGLLTLLDMANHTIALGLAVTVLITSLLLNGAPVFQLIQRKVG